MAAAPNVERRRYPEHEARHPWLERLLDAYHLCDAAVRADLERETARRGAPPACGPGCYVCCVGQVVPVCDFEALGLWWFCAEIMEPGEQERLRVNLLAHEPGHASRACPFLLDGACSVYVLRPVVCRQHVVFGRPCRPGENLRMDRPGDVLTAGTSAGRDMAWQILPLYGVREDDIDRCYENGYVGRKAKDLHSLPLGGIVEHMDAARRRRDANA